MTVLIDTSFLVALVNVDDAKHHNATRTQALLQEKRVVPAPVLPEMFYMVATWVNYSVAVEIFVQLQSPDFEIVDLTLSDMARMREIMVQYADVRFDFVDVSIMALAERLNITRVCTFDRRDFGIFRPAHCDYLEILP